MNCQPNIDAHRAMLDQLLAAPSIRYADWPKTDKTALRNAAGVYHFYEIVEGRVRSLYIGKGSFGRGGEWSLGSRIHQHFRPSQKYALLGKMSRATGVSSIECKTQLEQSGTCLQWLSMCERSGKRGNLDAEICWFEYFAISVLKPCYTDG